MFYRNISDPTVDSENGNQPQEQVQMSSETHRETQNVGTGSSPQYSASQLPRLPETGPNFGGGVSSGPKSDEPNSSNQCDMAEFEFDEGLDGLDDVDVTEDDLMQTELFDQPGHEEWEDKLDDFEHKIMENQDLIFQASEGKLKIVRI